MITRNSTLWISSLLVFLCSCTLDDFMYSPETNIAAYQLDAYEGNGEIEVGDEYLIPASDIVQFVLPGNADQPEDIHCIFVGDTSTIGSKEVILYCHGNSGNMDRYWPRVKLLANTGSPLKYNIMMIDYRGFGLTGGEATQEHLVEDVQDAIDWLASKGLKGQQLTLYGYSLGSYPATYLMSESTSLTPRRLVLENPFSSTSAMSSDATGLSFPSALVMDDDFDNQENIKKVHQPFLWFHGLADDFLPVATHGQVVWDNYNGNQGTKYMVEGAEHSNLPEVMGYKEYLQAVEGFMK